ncbi:MAG: alpha/beta hydrolase [Candidatus Kaiserbacteria bacterium]|nr:alpha/beta hydrolase [Candidatus Kaiserbacteria bacterium]
MISKILRWFLYALLATLVALALLGEFFYLAAERREIADNHTAAPAYGRFVKAGDVNLYIQEWGPSTGTPIVLVHAAGGWSGVWQTTGEALAAHGYHVIAPDMPPLGFSDRPDSPRYSRADQAARLVALLDALKIPRAVFVGHSFGARAVAEVAINNPDRVSGIVFVDAALGLQSTSSPLLADILAPKIIRRAITAATLSNPAFTKTLLDKFVANPDTATPEWVSIYQAALNVKGTTNATADWLPTLVAEQGQFKSKDPANYRAIKAPTLILWGEADSVTPISQGRFLESLIKGAQFQSIPAVGHLPPIEVTKEFDDALLKFLDTHKTLLAKGAACAPGVMCS